MIELLPAKPKEAKEMLLLQQLAFQSLLDKYQDFKTNPAMNSQKGLRLSLFFLLIEIKGLLKKLSA